MAPSDKLVPAATTEDQEGVVTRTLGEPTVLGTPAFSSPDPATDGYRMLAPVTDDVTGEHGAQGASSEDPSEMKAADFKERVEAATTQEELDAAALEYQQSGKEYATVESAIEKKQDEINEQQS